MDAAFYVSLHGAFLATTLYVEQCHSVLYAFWTSYVRNPNESFKTFLTLVEIIEVTKLFLYVELENHHFEQMKKYILHCLFAGLLEWYDFDFHLDKIKIFLE